MAIAETERDALFDFQLAILGDRGCPRYVCKLLLAQKEKVLKAAEGDIPFLPVVPFALWDIDKQVKAILGEEGRQGVNHLKIEGIKEVFTRPSPYFILDVEPGIQTLGISVVLAKAFISKARRIPLSVAELISLAMHSNMRHNILAAGAHYEKPNVVPALIAKKDGRIALCVRYANDIFGNFGTPSFKRTFSWRLSVSF